MRSYIRFLDEDKKLEGIVEDLNHELLHDLIEDILYERLEPLIERGYFPPDPEFTAGEKGFNWIMNLPYGAMRDVSKVLDRIYDSTLSCDEALLAEEEDQQERLRLKIEAITAYYKVGLSKRFLNKAFRRDISRLLKLRLSLLLTKVEGSELNGSLWEKRINVEDKESQYLAPVLISIYKRSQPFKSLTILSDLARTEYAPSEEFRKFYYTGIQQAIFLALNPIAFQIDKFSSIIKAEEERKATYQKFVAWWMQVLPAGWAKSIILQIMEHPKFEEIKLLLINEFKLDLTETTSDIGDTTMERVSKIMDQLSYEDLKQVKGSRRVEILKKAPYWPYATEVIIKRLPDPEKVDEKLKDHLLYSSLFEQFYEQLGEEFTALLESKFQLIYDEENGIIRRDQNIIKKIKLDKQIKDEAIDLTRKQIPSNQKVLFEMLYEKVSPN